MEWVWLAVGLIACLVVGVALRRRIRGGKSADRSSDQHRDARTSTLDSQKRMNLDSKGPFG